MYIFFIRSRLTRLWPNKIYILIVLIIRPVESPILPDNPTDLFSFSHIVFYISNTYIPEGFPSDYNNGYIQLRDGIVFYTSLSLNYFVQCSSEHDYHLLLPAQMKNIFPFFPLSL